MNDKENIQWHFEELIKTLIILSSAAEKQFEMMGYGCPGDEMVEDFDSHYRVQRKGFIDNGLINQEQSANLDQLDSYLAERSGKDEYLDFWTDSNQLSMHPDWEEIRQLSVNCLIILRKDHLGLKVTIDNQPGKSNKGEDLIIQVVKTELIEKAE